MVKLISVKPSTRSDKKYMATFENPKKITHFGAKGYTDYTKGADDETREDYIKRHAGDLDTNDPMRAGYLSMFLLWNKKSLKDSVRDYEKRLKSNDWSLPASN